MGTNATTTQKKITPERLVEIKKQLEDLHNEITGTDTQCLFAIELEENVTVLSNCTQGFLFELKNSINKAILKW